jgi:c-di-GMP-binding flagellar brake protein YcgR
MDAISRSTGFRPGPEPEGPDTEQYALYSRVEIIALMRELKERRVLVTLYFGGGERSLVTSVLAVNPDFEELVLDCGAHERDNEAMLASGRLIVVSFIDHVKVQFAAGRAQRTTFEGGPALRLRLPESVLRLQRRNYFRVPTPIGRPLKVQMPHEAATPSGEMRVVDLSCGGVGIVTQPAPQLEPGAILEDCRIELPGVGPVTVSLEIRHVSVVPGPKGTMQVRCGLQFVALPAASYAMIQRYINKLQAERRSRT